MNKDLYDGSLAQRPICGQYCCCGNNRPEQLTKNTITDLIMPVREEQGKTILLIFIYGYFHLNSLFCQPSVFNYNTSWLHNLINILHATFI